MENKPSLLERYWAIFSDPFFWVITLVFALLGYLIYRKYVVGNLHYDETEARLRAYLKHYGYTLLGSQTQTDAGPFAPSGEVEKAPHCAYRTVKAVDAQQKETEFWVQLTYENAQIVNMSWVPAVEG